MLKTSIFGWPEILDFFQNRARGGGPRGTPLVFFLQCCFFLVLCGSGAVFRAELDPIFIVFLNFFFLVLWGSGAAFGPDLDLIFT